MSKKEKILKVAEILVKLNNQKKEIEEKIKKFKKMLVDNGVSRVKLEVDNEMWEIKKQYRESRKINIKELSLDDMQIVWKSGLEVDFSKVEKILGKKRAVEYSSVVKCSTSEFLTIKKKTK